MTRTHRIILLAVLLLGACRNKKDVEYARRSVYDTDFANVYNAALGATRELYPELNDNPGPGRISTAWHEVRYGNNQDAVQNTRTMAPSSSAQGGMQSGGIGTAGSTTIPTRLAYKRYFIRFDVSVVGGRPWRVKVVGHAREWDPGAVPSDMRGAQRPSWLDGRTEALQVAIYRRIKQFAIPMKEEIVVASEDTTPKTDPGTFKDIPAGAAKTLATIKDAVVRRDYAALRTQLDDNVTWSLGGGTGADVAIATWQADPGTLDSMLAAINAGCALADKTVACPQGAPQTNVYQLVLEERQGAWRVTSFVKAE